MKNKHASKHMLPNYHVDYLIDTIKKCAVMCDEVGSFPKELGMNEQ